MQRQQPRLAQKQVPRRQEQALLLQARVLQLLAQVPLLVLATREPRHLQ